jgi:hypothetical protein
VLRGVLVVLAQTRQTSEYRPPVIESHKIDSWDALLAELKALRTGWSFRGQEDAEWALTTSLDRSGSLDARVDEAILLDRFQRRARTRLASQLIPDDEDVLAWWAIMQHYGAPTRLLDLTRSPYVALFFAFEMPALSAFDNCRRRTLWAFDVNALQRRAIEVLAEIWRDSPHRKELDDLHWDQREVVRNLYRHDDALGVIVAEPWQFDERQQAQQTQFLVPCAVSQTFEFNLRALEPCPGLVKRFDIAGVLRCEVLSELVRMNVTAASLFPGLDGFGRSMRSYLHAAP